MPLRSFPSREHQIRSPPAPPFSATRDVPLGVGQIKKTELIVTLNSTSTNWGAFKDRACGFLVLQFDFHQHPEYKLEHASGELLFGNGTELGDHLHPDLLTGNSRERRKQVSVEAVPNVGAMGFNIGGVGVKHSTDSTQEYHWTLRTGRKPGQQPDERHRHCRMWWKLEDGRHGDSSVFNCPFRVLVQLDFDDMSLKPFDVSLQMKGRLRSRVPIKNLFRIDLERPNYHMSIAPPASSPPLKMLDTLVAGMIKDIEEENKKNLRHDDGTK